MNDKRHLSMGASFGISAQQLRKKDYLDALVSVLLGESCSWV